MAEKSNQSFGEKLYANILAALFVLLFAYVMGMILSYFFPELNLFGEFGKASKPIPLLSRKDMEDKLNEAEKSRPGLVAAIRKIIKCRTGDFKLLKSGVDTSVCKRFEHLVLMGNPGTGKTSGVELIAQALMSFGVMKPKAPVITVVGRDLVGQHIGSTEANVRTIAEKARGGILFIDEAYMLNDGSSSDGRNFGAIAIDALMDVMGRRDTLVILAGYEDKMKEFLDSNAGLFRRTGSQITLRPYTQTQIGDIVINLIKQRNQEAGFNGNAVGDKITDIDTMEKSNAGYAEKIVNGLQDAMNERCKDETDDECLMTFTEADLDAAFEVLNEDNSVDMFSNISASAPFGVVYD